MKHLFLFLLVLGLGAVAAREHRPNIVFILADDMGYGDVQALNPDSAIPTPALNRLAREGMTFTDAHSPSAVCTPTRYATLTGRYCWRSTLKSGVLNGYGPPLIEKERPTVASHLREAGYRTAVVGKWHLGLGFRKDERGEWDWAQPLDHSPLDLGFDRSFIIPASLDFPPYVYIEGRTVTGLPLAEQEAIPFPGFVRKGEIGSNFSIVDCLDRLTGEAAAFIRESGPEDEPYFLYFPLTAPHKPVLPHPRFEGRTDLGPYGDFIVQVDDAVGQILEAVDDSGEADHTVLIYTSDNGSFMYRQTADAGADHVADSSVQAYDEKSHTANGDLRGTKADIWEAGHRVPFFVRWPDVIEPGSRCEEVICHVDLFATASAIAGARLPSPDTAAPDSFDLTPLFRGEPEAFRRAPVVNHSAAGMFAVRDGDWKLILGNGSGGREQPRGSRFQTPWQLYHLGDDPGETKDLYEKEKARADRMAAALFQILADDESRSLAPEKKRK